MVTSKELQNINFENEKVKVCPKCLTTLIYKLKSGKYRCYNCEPTPENPNNEVDPIERESERKKVEPEKRKKSPKKKFKGDLPNENSLFELLNKTYSPDEKKIKCFLAMLYLTGCRFRELMQLRKKDCYETTITLDDQQIRTYIIDYIPVFKKREKIERRTVHCNPELDKRWITFINDYFEEIKNMHDEEAIFSSYSVEAYPLIRRMKWEIDKSLFPHAIRHIRAIELSKRMNYFELKDFFSWSTIQMADIYVTAKKNEVIRKSMNLS